MTFRFHRTASQNQEHGSYKRPDALGRLAVLARGSALVSLVGLTLSATGCESTDRPLDNPYPTYGSFQELVNSTDARYVETLRVTSPGTDDSPTDHGFFLCNCQHVQLLQFDPTRRYMLALRVFFEGRDVRPGGGAVIGIVDLENDNTRSEFGLSTAWNWQQGNRLQWIPGSVE